MQRLKFIILASLMVFPLLSMNATALELMSGDSVVVEEDVIDDLYLLAGNATIEADVFGDLHVLGGSVTVNADIKEDLIVGGGRVVIFGDIEGDLRILGGQVSIYGNVGDDLVVLGGQIDIGPEAVVNGSALVGAGLMTVEGVVNEDVQGGLGMFVLNGVVGGDINLTIEDTISLSEGSSVEGNLNYSAILETEFPPGVVKGKTNFNQFVQEDVGNETDTAAVFFAFKILSFIAALILMLLFVVLAPKALEKSAALTSANILKSFAVGLLTMILAFIGSIILMMTVIGIPLALIASALLLVLFYISKIYVAAWVAGYFMNFKKKKHLRLRFFALMTLALFAYYLVGMVPYVGWLINLVLFLIGAGAVVLLDLQYWDFLKSKKQV